MSLNNPKGGIGYAAEFQSSALPWTTSSQAMTGVTYRIDFPKVTRFITIKNHGGATEHLRLGFTRNGIENGNNFRILGSANGTPESTFELRVKEIYIRADGAVSPHYSILAGLTNIDSEQMGLLSGTLSDGTSGWAGVG